MTSKFDMHLVIINVSHPRLYLIRAQGSNCLKRKILEFELEKIWITLATVRSEQALVPSQ